MLLWIVGLNLAKRQYCTTHLELDVERYFNLQNYVITTRDHSVVATSSSLFLNLKVDDTGNAQVIQKRYV